MNIALTIPPVPPDFILCDLAYGSQLTNIDCIGAKERMPAGENVVVYSLPLSVQYETCHISVEAAGPHPLYAPWMARPDVVRGMAGYVIQQCVQSPGTAQNAGRGGFMVVGFNALSNYVLNPHTNYIPSGPIPPSTTFITVTVSGPIQRLLSPGNTDPYIPLIISQTFDVMAQQEEPHSTMANFYASASYVWRMDTIGMTRGGPKTWWSKSSGPDEMTYECDANLGSPPAVDCTQIEWNQLGPASVNPPSDTVTVGPGVVEFLHSNTCYLAISAAVKTVLSWDQIRAAVGALLNLCVESPKQAKTGGRAHFGTPAPASSRRRKRQTQVSGLNALPPQASIAIFEQKEPWTNPTTEMKSCTWDAVMNKRSVSLCK